MVSNFGVTRWHAGTGTETTRPAGFLDRRFVSKLHLVWALTDDEAITICPCPEKANPASVVEDSSPELTLTSSAGNL